MFLLILVTFAAILRKIKILKNQDGDQYGGHVCHSNSS